MNCERFIALCDEFHAGTLDAVTRLAADQHLGSCRRCQTEYGALKGLLRAAAALPAEQQPGHDLWPGVAARLKPRAETRRPVGLVQYALAATVVLAVGGMATLVFRAPATPSAAVSPSTLASLPDLGADRGRAEFVAHLAVSESGMAPETRALVVRNLQVIEQALGEIEAAMRRDPNDPNVRALLTRIHQQESALIDQVQRISMNHAKRTDI